MTDRAYQDPRTDWIERLRIRMLDIARRLSAGFPFVRVDLYNNTGQIYFGELTFYHASGYQNIQPEAFHEQLGSHLDLSRV